MSDMNAKRFSGFLSRWWIVILFIAAKLVIHFLTNANYELQRDAYLYIEQGKHLAWGYASTPPSIGVFADLSRWIFGDNTFAIRFFPALIGALSILIIGIMVREMEGGAMATVLACTAFLVSPAFLRSNSLFQPVSFNQFYWLLTFFLIFRLIRTNNPWYWIWIGIISGLAILNKHSALVFQACVFFSFLATHHRRWFRTWYPYAALAIVVVMVFPHAYWQYEHGWPLIRHFRELAATQLVHVRLDLFMADQFLMNLPAVLIWLSGIYYVIFREEEDFQIFAVIFALTMGVLMMLHGKSYYTLGLYAVMFVFGAVFLEETFSKRLKFINPLILGVMALVGIIAIPLGLPVLKPERFISYAKMIGREHSERWEDGQYHELPQDYADMIGWKELAGIVGSAWQSLDKEQQSVCTIFANNYGEAGSVDFYGKAYGLPPVVSYNDSYLLWAPDEVRADYLIKIGTDDNLEELYDSIRVFGRITTPYARQEGTPVYLCFRPKLDINEFYRNELHELRNEAME